MRRILRLRNCGPIYPVWPFFASSECLTGVLCVDGPLECTEERPEEPSVSHHSPVGIATSRAEMLRSIAGYNAGYVQPRHGRKVLQDSTKD